jgi:glycosyltransferase involved in cell wall biosynthesis
VLVITPTCPVPARDGGRLRVLHLARELSRQGFRVEMLALDDGRAPSYAIQRMAAYGIRLTLVPHRPSRVLAPLRALVSGRSVYAALFDSHAMRRAIGERLTQDPHVDVLQVEYGYLGHYLRLGRGSGAVRVLDEHNLEWELAGSGKSATGPRGLAYSAYARRERRRRMKEERDAAREADLVLVVSAQDRDGLAAIVPAAAAAIVPNGVDLERFHESPGAADGPGHAEAIFVGKMDYGPNADGADWLIREVWPVVRDRHPHARLRIVGANPPARLRARHGRDGVEITGEVPETRPYLAAADVALVPLRRGGGTRLKVIEALAAGRPVVATSVGVAGLELPVDIVPPTDDAADFAARVVALLEAPGEREGVAERGRQSVEARYGWAAIGASLADVLRRIGGGPSEQASPSSTVGPAGETRIG